MALPVSVLPVLFAVVVAPFAVAALLPGAVFTDSPGLPRFAKMPLLLASLPAGNCVAAGLGQFLPNATNPTIFRHNSPAFGYWNNLFIESEVI